MNVGAPQTPTRRLSEQFADRVRHAPDRQLAERMRGIVTYVAQYIEKEKIDRSELRAMVNFFTDVGLASDWQRSEWALLSDALGITSLVEELESRRPHGATPNTIAGPFYRPGAPERANGETISLDGIGDELTLMLEVTDLHGQSVAGARIEVWQANSDGLYENQAPDQQPESNLRGTFTTQSDGTAIIRSVRPKGYGIPSDGPVGMLMAQLGLSPVRPAHVHFRITASGFSTLTTHLFDGDDPAVEADPLFAVHPALITRFRPCAQGGFEAHHRFILAPTRSGRDTA